MRRPQRATDTPADPPVPVTHSPIPNIDLDAAEAVAFSRQGRATRPEGTPGGTASPTQGAYLPKPAHTDAAVPRTELAGAAGANSPSQAPPVREIGEPEITAGGTSAGSELVSVKLPPDVGRQLAAIADRRGSKRTLVAIEALSEPLRTLAAAHRAGGFPELPRVISGTVRSSIAFALPPDLAADLEYVLRARRAVRAQVVTRLLAPAIHDMYEVEVTGRSR